MSHVVGQLQLIRVKCTNIHVKSRSVGSVNGNMECKTDKSPSYSALEYALTLLFSFYCHSFMGPEAYL